MPVKDKYWKSEQWYEEGGDIIITDNKLQKHVVTIPIYLWHIFRSFKR